MKITWLLTSLAIGIGVLGQATPTEANLLKQLRKNFLRGNGDGGGDAAAAAIEAHDRLLQEATSSMSMMISDIDNIALPSLLPTDKITELVDDMKAEDIDISLSTAMTIMALNSDELPAYHHGSDNFCVWFVNKMTHHLPLPHTHQHVDGTGGKNCPYLLGKLCDVKPTPTPKPSTSTTTLKPTDNPSSNPTVEKGPLARPDFYDFDFNPQIVFLEVLENDEARPASQGPLLVVDVFGREDGAFLENIQYEEYLAAGEVFDTTIATTGGLGNRRLQTTFAGGTVQITGNRQRVRYTPPISTTSDFEDVFFYTAGDQNGLISAQTPVFLSLSPSLTPTHTPTHTPTLLPTAYPISSSTPEV